MALGYDGKLYILAFDHRGSFQKKMFGIEGDPTPEETETIADAKHLIFEGMLEARVERGADAGRDRRARRRAVRLATSPPRPRSAASSSPMPVEKTGQDEFDFQYGDDFGEHIESFDPDFSKVLVRYNPDGDAEMNERQLGAAQAARRLAARATTASSSSSCSCRPTTPSSSRSAATRDRYDAELRPELMRRAIEEIQDFGIEVDIWKIEGVDEPRGLPRCSPSRPARATAARASSAWCSAAAPTTRRSTTGCAQARARRGLRRLRDRPLDLVGRAEGLPRRHARARAPPPSRSPTTTCASSRSTSEAAEPGARGLVVRAPRARLCDNCATPRACRRRAGCTVAPVSWTRRDPCVVLFAGGGGRRGRSARRAAAARRRRGWADGRAAGAGHACGRRRHDPGAHRRQRRARPLHRRRHARDGQARHAGAVLRQGRQRVQPPARGRPAVRLRFDAEQRDRYGRCSPTCTARATACSSTPRWCAAATRRR